MRADLTLYIVRHGQTDWNAEFRYQGQADIPLNETGRGQARRNGEALRQVPGAASLDFVASPLVRALETMRLARAAIGLAPGDFRVDPLLRELHYGRWQGQLAADLATTDPEGLAARARDPFHWRPNGGETFAELMARTDAWLASVSRDTAVVAHGGVMRALRGRLLDLEAQGIPRLDVPQDRVLVLRKGWMDWL